MDTIIVSWNVLRGCWDVRNRSTGQKVGTAFQVLLRDAQVVGGAVFGLLHAAVWERDGSAPPISWEADRAEIERIRRWAHRHGCCYRGLAGLVTSAPMLYLTWEHDTDLAPLPSVIAFDPARMHA